MKISVLERMLVAERMRQKASFAPPVANRRAASHDEGPWVVTNTKGDVVLTRLQHDPKFEEDFVLQGFFDCPIDEESPLVSRLYDTLWASSKKHGWDNRCKSLKDSAAKMASLGYDPKWLLIPHSEVEEVCGGELTPEDVEKLTLVKGYVAEVDSVKVLVTDALPEGAAILGTLPSLVGHYMRSYDYLSILLAGVNRTIVLVGHDTVD